MDAAAQQLVGLHDFAAFCKPRERATTVRTLLHYRWVRDEFGVLVADVRADAFCHSMVRSLVGGVLAVGLGDLTQHQLENILRNAVKANAFPVVVARGLTLAEVGYPADEQLQARATLTRARRELAAQVLSPPD
jgi:tRNA pseudouridine38-40 synthase